MFAVRCSLLPLVSLLAASVIASPSVAADLPDSAALLVPDAWSMEAGEQPAPDAWWLSLGGEELDGLVREAARHNLDNRISGERVRQANARTMASTANLLPSLSASGTVMSGPSSVQGSSDKSMEQGSMSLDVSVPLNLWTTLPSRSAAVSDGNSARASEDGVAVRTATTTARLWLDVVYARQRLEVVEAQIEGDTSILDLVEARYTAGNTSAVDVLQQRQQLAASNSKHPDAVAAVGKAERALAVHLKRSPGRPVHVSTSVLPQAPPVSALPAPKELVMSHPSVLGAVADFEASRSRATAAKAGYLPSLSATASTGWTVTSLSGSEVADTWSAGARVLPHGGGRQGPCRGQASADRTGHRRADRGTRTCAVDSSCWPSSLCPTLPLPMIPPST